MCSYYSNSGKATLDQFYSVSVLDSFLTDAKEFSAIRDRVMPGVALWLGETGSMYSTVVPHLANSYVDGFTYVSCA